MMSNKVDLPDPLGPVTSSNSPLLSSTLMSLPRARPSGVEKLTSHSEAIDCTVCIPLLKCVQQRIGNMVLKFFVVSQITVFLY